MWAEYLKEREDFESVQTEHGFATYKVFGTECYLRDIYVKPEHRRSGETYRLSEMVKQKAIEAGCQYLSGSVCLSAKDPSRSIKTVLANGFEVLKYDRELLWFVKKI